MDQTQYVNSYIVSTKLKKMLSTNDRRFLVNVSPMYVLPFGRDKFIGRNMPRPVDLAIGGCEHSGIYTYNSGSPLSFATNSAYWDGTDPCLGSKQTRNERFDTSKFYPFPSHSASVGTIARYPT
jgi:hypothetical protein